MLELQKLNYMNQIIIKIKLVIIRYKNRIAIIKEISDLTIFTMEYHFNGQKRYCTEN